MSDSYNHLFGQCVNAINRKLISGGSSGGESALLSSLGSPLGIGTDIGGSIRIPAALCGLYGLSPSVSRHPYPRGGYVMIRNVNVGSSTDPSQAEAKFCSTHCRTPGIKPRHH